MLLIKSCIYDYESLVIRNKMTNFATINNKE